MAIVHSIRCDRCGRSQEFVRDVAPDGWQEASLKVGKLLNETVHVCAACVEDFAIAALDRGFRSAATALYIEENTDG